MVERGARERLHSPCGWLQAQPGDTRVMAPAAWDWAPVGIRGCKQPGFAMEALMGL